MPKRSGAVGCRWDSRGGTIPDARRPLLGLRDDPYGLTTTSRAVTPTRSGLRLTLEIVDDSSEGVKFVVPGSLCPAIVSVDVLAEGLRPIEWCN